MGLWRRRPKVERPPDPFVRAIVDSMTQHPENWEIQNGRLHSRHHAMYQYHYDFKPRQLFHSGGPMSFYPDDKQQIDYAAAQCFEWHLRKLDNAAELTKQQQELRDQARSLRDHIRSQSC